MLHQKQATYRVEDDAKLKDQESGKLLSKGAILRSLEFLDHDRILNLLKGVFVGGLLQVLCCGACQIRVGVGTVCGGLDIVILQQNRREVGAVWVSVAHGLATAGNDVLDVVVLL